MVKCVSSFLLFSLLSVQAISAENHIDLHQPKDFVDITTVAPRRTGRHAILQFP